MRSEPRDRERMLVAAVVALCAAALLLPVVHQDQAYHHFADARMLLGVPRALDTLSNLAFIAAGLWGLRAMFGDRLFFFSRALRTSALVFFVGFIATGVGSAIYHVAPDDPKLALDRFGMIVTFAGVLGMAAAQRVSERAGFGLLAVSLVLGPLWVVVWLIGGSVTPYGVMQFGGLALVLALLRAPARGPGPDWAWLVVGYALSKVFEFADAQIFEWSGQLMSGHTLKHLSAAVTALAVTRGLARQRFGRELRTST